MNKTIKEYYNCVDIVDGKWIEFWLDINDTYFAKSEKLCRFEEILYKSRITLEEYKNNISNIEVVWEYDGTNYNVIKLNIFHFFISSNGKPLIIKDN